jgi:glucose-6-phosphate isomerase
MIAAPIATQSESPGRLAPAMASALQALNRAGAVRRLKERDPNLWPGDAAARREIAERLGWLEAPEWLNAHAAEIQAFVRRVRGDGLEQAILLGMGGSSLAPEVLERVAGVAPGFLELEALDSTDPEAVARVDEAIDYGHTLFIVASKSGGTIETLSHYRFFRARVDAAGPKEAGRCFVAITDAGSPLDQLAGQHGFRHVFRNPADIGGRYSALSYFGMVPAGLMGQDLDAYAAAAAAMARVAFAETEDSNPAARLGAFAAAGALAGADKLTLLTSPRLRPLGYWIEQLVAESTGKDGRGIVPVEGEPCGIASDYGDDRCFVLLRLAGEEGTEHTELASAAKSAGQPLVEIVIPDVFALAGEFLRWEVATAVAGHLLGVNPFDQPNVQESKDRTAAILKSGHEEHGRAKERTSLPAGTQTTVGIHASESTWSRLGSPTTPDAALDAFLGLAVPGEYIALLTYIARSEERETWASRVRRALRDATRVPVLHGYGPRFLHSIGQLYKGGPASGLFIQVTHDPERDLPIPQAEWSFGKLEAAQARGDLEALDARGKPVLRFHVTGAVDAGLEMVRDGLMAAAARIGRQG